MRISKIINTIAVFAILAGSFATLSSSAAAQKQDDGILGEKRPFDFSDKHYRNNGVDSSLIIARRTGLDGASVIDFINSDIFRDVRILETRTAYDENGKQVFWIHYGYMDWSSFTPDRAGREAADNAAKLPVYLFPSAEFRGQERQAALIDSRDSSAEKNPLGLGSIVDVEFTRKAYSKEGQRLLAELIGKNGKSLDGFPIIKTPTEINILTRYELITQRARSVSRPGEPQFIITRILKDPRLGAISPDAFLEFTAFEGKPIDAESGFYEEFECLQKSGKYCEEK